MKVSKKTISKLKGQQGILKLGSKLKKTSEERKDIQNKYKASLEELDNLQEKINIIKNVKALDFNEYSIKVKKSSKKSESTAVAVYSDRHIEEEV